MLLLEVLRQYNLVLVHVCADAALCALIVLVLENKMALGVAFHIEVLAAQRARPDGRHFGHVVEYDICVGVVIIEGGGGI